MDNKYGKNRIENAYRRCYFKGKSRFGRTVDTVAFAFLFSAAAYVSARAFGNSVTEARFIGVAVGLGFLPAYSAITAIKIDRYSVKKSQQIEAALAKRKLLLESDAETEDRIRRLSTDRSEYAYELIKKAAPISEDDICKAAREHSGKLYGKLILITMNAPDDKLRAFANRLTRPQVGFVLFTECGELYEGYRASEDEIAEEIISEAEMKPPKRSLPSAEEMFSGAGKYRALGVLLFLASFVMRFSLYLRTLSMICFAASLAAGARNRAKKQQAAAN